MRLRPVDAIAPFAWTMLLAITPALGCTGCTAQEGPAWEEIASEGVPARWGHVAAYDEDRDRMLVFGGEGGEGQRDDVWALQLDSSQWSQVETVADPGKRSDMAEVLDSARGRWIVIGGRVGLASSIADVWALDLVTSTWSQLPSGPSPRHDVAAATDGARAWVFGGAGDLFQSLDDLWELDLVTDGWRELPRGAAHPIARTSYALAYWQGALYLQGGHDVSQVFRDTWRYDLAAQQWSQLVVDGAAVANAHFGHAVDEVCGTLLLSGGDNLDNFVVGISEVLTLNDRPRFTRLPASGLPPARDHTSLVIDRSRRELILYGGGALGDGLDTFGDAWRYPLGGCP